MDRWKLEGVLAETTNAVQRGKCGLLNGSGLAGTLNLEKALTFVEHIKDMMIVLNVLWYPFGRYE